MRHHIVADLLFPPGSQFEINIVDMLFQNQYLFRGYGQTKLVLGAGQFRPEPTPGADARALGEQAEQFL